MNLNIFFLTSILITSSAYAGPRCMTKDLKDSIGFYLEKEKSPRITTKDIEYIELSKDQPIKELIDDKLVDVDPSTYSLLFKLSNKGALKLKKLTEDNLNKVVTVKADGKTLASPTILIPIEDGKILLSKGKCDATLSNVAILLQDVCNTIPSN